MPPTLTGGVKTVGRRLVVCVPEVNGERPRRREALSSLSPVDIYLIAVGAMNDLVVRHDKRREAIKDFASEIEWSSRTLRETALRARLGGYVRHGRLTPKGWAQAAAGSDRLISLESPERDSNS